jgi:hypothetical protein
MYFFLPPDVDRLSYMYALFEISETNAEDNVKYCYGINIRSVFLSLNENCYRASELNIYNAKIINHLLYIKIMI